MFAMRHGNRDRYGRSAPRRRYAQQPSPDDCRIGAVQPKCQREDRFEVIGVGIVSVRQTDTSFRLGFSHDAAFAERFDRRPNRLNKHPEQFRQLHLGHPNFIAVDRHSYSIIPVYRNDFSFHRSRCLLIQRQYIARKHLLVHFPHLVPDQLLREFGVVPRHVGIRVSENLRQHVDRHPVLYGQASECMAGAVRRQFFVQSADRGDFGHIGIHLLITRNRQ